MRYWHAYTGESLIVGHGRAIRRVISDIRMLQRLLEVAEKHYVDYSQPHRIAFSKDTFIAALLAPLAMQELGAASPPATQFSSAGQVLSLFDALDIEQAAINLFNGRTASAYAESDEDAIAARVAQGFGEGDLLYLPRDATRLHSQEIMNTLPGAVAFLLSRSQAESKAFAGYLRRGTPPALSEEAIIAIAKSRSVLHTWEREASPLKERRYD